MKGYCTFLQLGRYGRFANQIFQIAGTIGIARMNGLEPIFPTWVNHDHKINFKSEEDVEVQRYFVNALPGLQQVDYWHPVSVPWGFHHINLAPGNYDLNGHMQSLKYFGHCIDEVKHYMRMKEEPEYCESVAVHVRRGDYDNKYHPRLDLSYYTDAVLKFDKGTRFIVFTDDPADVSNLISHIDKLTLGRYYFSIWKGDYINSFRRMKTCQSFIIGNSSYSAAAAILSDAKDKRVIAPKNWFGPSYASITASDVYCDDWIVI
jgi:hypothetical protein